jgi:pimeloyl-ACP methyl ester carboxylesterase
MTEQMLHVDGVLLCAETFGSPADPTIVLIAGGGQSMVWWESDFCQQLAAAGRHVVRYDHRDTGRSSSSPAGRPAYSAVDLATDPLRVMDALDISSAHLVGLSMGGGFAQVVAATHPDRVQTLTVIATSPACPLPDLHLPPPLPAVAESFTNPAPEPDWADRDAVVAYRVDIERPYTGTLGFDEDRVRQLARAEVDRTSDMAASITNNFVVDDPGPADVALDRLDMPTLVMHGTADTMFPLEHGKALARHIPGARFLPLQGMGHQQPPPPLWNTTCTALHQHTAPRHRIP